MAIQNTYDIETLKKVIVSKKSEGGGGGGESGPTPDVETITPDDEEGKGEEGKGEKGKGEGKGEEGKGEGKEEGKGDGKGQGQGQGQGQGGDSGQNADLEEVLKRAEDLLNTINSNTTGKNSCGSSKPRQEKNANSTEDYDERVEKSRQRIDDIYKAIEEAEKSGVPNPYGTKGRGSGGEKTASDVPYVPLPLEKPRPAFLDEITDFAERGYTREYTKKGTDWLYSEAFDYDVFFKDRPKVATPGKWMFLMVDCSGSMTSDFQGDGKSLFEHLIAYLPEIAKEFNGSVWWVSDGMIYFREDSYTGLSSPDAITVEEYDKSDSKKRTKGYLGITDLEVFKDVNREDRAKIYKDVTSAYGFGGGTTFATELQTAINIREKEGHDAAIVILTDSFIDSPNLEYTWNGEKVRGKLPPNTIIMTNTAGRDYLEDYFKEELESDKKIEVYDITDDGRYKFPSTKKL